MRHTPFRIALAILVTLSAPVFAQAPEADMQASPACDRSTAWPRVFEALKQSRVREPPSERLDVTLPDLVATGARSVPDGGPQRLRVRRIRPEEGAQVWLYPGRDRLRGLGDQAVQADPDTSAILLDASVPRNVTEGTEEQTELTVTVPPVANVTSGTSSGLLDRDASFLVIVCNSAKRQLVGFGVAEARISSFRAAVLLTTLAAVVAYAVAALISLAGRQSNPDDVAISVARLAATVKPLEHLSLLTITQDRTGRGSLSRLQIFFFTFVVMITLTCIYARVGVVSNVSEDVLWLLGIAGAGSAASAVVSANRNPNGCLAQDTIAWMTRHQLSPPRRRPRWRDIFFTGGGFDIYRFQNVAFSPFVGMSVLGAGLSGLASLDIPGNLLVLFGLSQGLYVGGKTISPPPGAAEVDKAVQEAAIAEDALVHAATEAGLIQDRAALRPNWEKLRTESKLHVQRVDWDYRAGVAAARISRFVDDDTPARVPDPA